MKKIFLSSLFALVALLVSCSKEETPSTPSTEKCTGDTPTYTNDVKSILDANCATSGCHDGGTKANGLDYSTYALVSTNASKSNFLGSIKHQGGFSAMPKGGSKLSDSQIKTLECWVKNGKPE